MEGLRVLIVDDEAELVSAIVERLNLRGFQAEGITSGEEALSHLSNTQCDVVLLDVKMPGLGGLDVIKEIKQQHPELAVILLTGHGSAQDVEVGMGLGAFDYLMKPVDIDVVVRTLLAATGRAE